jgi:signal transduction histidine kinase
MAQKSAERLREKPMLCKVHEALSRVYENEKNFELALIHFKKSQELVSEINIAETSASLRNLEISRKVESLEREKKLFETEKQLALEQVRKRISSDLHDEIGAALSGFSIYSDVVKQEILNGEREEAAHSIQSIGDESRELLERLSDIVWAINPRNDQFEKIILRLRNYALRMCDGKNIELDFQAEDALNNIVLPLDARNNFYLILKEAINNAIKYSCCTKLNIAVLKSEQKISVSIEDNGKGFEVSAVSEGNGLLNMRQRAREVHALFDLRSSPGHGAVLLLTMPY